MIIYKDKITGKEVLSDSYKIVTLEGDLGGTLLEVTAKLTTEVTDISDAVIGGNASAEGEDAGAGAEASSKSGIDVVLANRLEEVSMTKDEYKAYLRKYAKLIMTKVEPDRLDSLKACGKALSQKLLGLFKDAQLFVGEESQGMQFDDATPCMVILADYQDDGKTVKMYYWRDGLDEEKM